MKTLKKTTASLIAFALSASAFAASDMDARVRELEKKMDKIAVTTDTGSFGACTATARPEPDGKGWFLSLDVLYWQTKVGGSAYAISNQKEINSPVIQVGTVREPSFKWDFGVKAGIGYDFNHDGWDIYGEFTYLNNTANSSSSVSSPAGLMPINAPLWLTASSQQNILNNNYAEFATNASSNLDMKFYDLNLELGRDFFVSKELAFRPHFGLKSTWITLDQNSKFTGGSTAYTITDTAGNAVNINGLNLSTLYSDTDSKVYGLGPRAGVNSRWFLGEGFSFYGDASSALLFGYLNNKYESNYSTYPDNTVKVKYKFHALIPTTNFGLGLAYDKYTMNNTQHIHISLGYENQIFWDSSYLAGATASPYNIGFYGVDLKVRWDF